MRVDDTPESLVREVRINNHQTKQLRPASAFPVNEGLDHHACSNQQQEDGKELHLNAGNAAQAAEQS